MCIISVWDLCISCKSKTDIELPMLFKLCLAFFSFSLSLLLCLCLCLSLIFFSLALNYSALPLSQLLGIFCMGQKRATTTCVNFKLAKHVWNHFNMILSHFYCFGYK